MQLINIADIENPETGKTYREENNALTHTYKVGALVEILPWSEDCEYSGMRLYVIGCVRDCDGTPLYVLGSRGMELWQKAFVKPNTCYNFNSFSGFSESSLKLVHQTKTHWFILKIAQFKQWFILCVRRVLPEHTCKYCGCKTRQPDSECYASPE